MTIINEILQVSQTEVKYHDTIRKDVKIPPYRTKFESLSQLVWTDEFIYKERNALLFSSNSYYKYHLNAFNKNETFMWHYRYNKVYL